MPRRKGHWPDRAIPYIIAMAYACFFVLAFVVVGGYVPLMLFGRPDWYAGAVAGVALVLGLRLEER